MVFLCTNWLLIWLAVFLFCGDNWGGVYCICRSGDWNWDHHVGVFQPILSKDGGFIPWKPLVNKPNVMFLIKFLSDGQWMRPVVDGMISAVLWTLLYASGVLFMAKIRAKKVIKKECKSGSEDDG